MRYLIQLESSRDPGIGPEPRTARWPTAPTEPPGQLHRAAEGFGDALSLSPGPAWIYDPRSLRFLVVNDAAVAFYGYSREQFMAMTVLDIRPAAERQRMLAAAQNRSSASEAATWRHLRADGLEVEVVVHRRVISFNGVEAVSVYVVDRTDVRELRRSLVDMQLVRDTIIAALPVGLFLKDMKDDGRYVIYNPTIRRMAGRAFGEVLGKTDSEVFGPKRGAELVAQDQCVMLSGQQQVFEEEETDAESGESHIFSTVKKPLPTSDGSEPRYLLGICEDITERRKSEERIAHLAMYDFLTDLPNRVLFQEHLKRTVRRGQKTHAVALFYLDLDAFKTINDTHGHQTGDLLLKQVAMRLRACLRRGDLVARLGGDEFAVVARLRRGEAEALTLAARLLESFDAPFELGECVVHVDTSIGIALSQPESQGTVEALMRHADIALYAAKAEGRGSAKIYADRMSSTIVARQLMSEDLRRGLDRGEFELHYQPILDLRTNRISGFEALVRWRHPSRGVISPGEFIAIAEQTGLIVPIGEWVLGEACRTAAAWPAEIKIAVNLSAVQFKKPGLVAMIERTLAESRFPPGRLELEITESVLLADSGTNLQILHRLRAAGVRIAMDDFGTGYSSLSYLRSFPFDKLKMDRSFVVDVCENDGSLAIMRAVTGLGSSLSITTTAEGIETPEQFARLQAEGFDELQGYLIGRPMPADRAATLAVRQVPDMLNATAA